MSESAEVFDAMREESRSRRESNRQRSLDLLRAHGLEFQARNDGAHLVVETHRGRVDFWPGTGLWEVRDTKKRSRGVFKLIAWALERGKERP